MAIFTNSKLDSPIASVEFSPMVDGNLSFFHIRKGADIAAVKQSLLNNLGQDVRAETVTNGQTVLMTRGATSQEDIIKTLDAGGDKLEPVFSKKKMDAWVWRGALSMVGQIMQLGSGIWAANKLTAAALGRGLTVKTATSPKDFVLKGMDVSIFTFAVFNIMANLTNMFFGAEKRTDEHKLRNLKQQSNDRLSPHVQRDATLPDINEKRADLRKEPEKEKTIAAKFNDFMHRNSVTIGEIGLRYVAAIGLVFPMLKENPKTGKQTFEHWGDGFKKMGHGVSDLATKGVPELIKTGSGARAAESFKPLKEGFLRLRNPNKFIVTAGSLYILGKAIALTSKVPDPYNPEHHTWLDKVRENVTFKASSLIEAGAAGMIAYNAFTNKKIILPGNKLLGIPKEGKLMSFDFLGGVGGGLFTVAQTTRFFAKYGERKVDKEELYAHVVDSLALMPPEKLPQLMLDSAVMIHNNLGTHGKHNKAEVLNDSIAIGKVYSDLAEDLYRTHNIAGPSAVAKTEKLTLDTQVAGRAAHVEVLPPEKTFASRLEPKKSDFMLPRPSSFQEAALTGSQTPQSLGI